MREYHHPDRLGTRLVTNNAANTSFEQSTLPFGTALPSESTGFSNQVFTSYDRSPIAGLDYAVNRTYSSGQGRFTTVDPIGMASVSIANPQSFNLYAYVQNNPIDFVDPTGLYEACIHQAMTELIGRMANLVPFVADRLAAYTGDGPGGADSVEFSATNPANIVKCSLGAGPSVIIHFPSEAQLRANIRNYRRYLAIGLSGDDFYFQQAGFMIHSIQDALGAHSGYSNAGCRGHAPRFAPDRVIGDKKFIAAANKVFQVMSGKSNAKLTPDQIKKLVAYIKEKCGKKHPDIKDQSPAKATMGGSVDIDSEHGGGELMIWQGQGPFAIDLLTDWYSKYTAQVITL